jgi:hypothetical protein
LASISSISGIFILRFDESTVYNLPSDYDIYAYNCFLNLNDFSFIPILRFLSIILKNILASTKFRWSSMSLMSSLFFIIDLLPEVDTKVTKKSLIAEISTELSP